MNGLIMAVAQFWSQALVDGATFVRDQQDKIASTTFTTNDFVQSSAKLWLNNTSNWYRLMGLATSIGGGTVVLQLPALASGPKSDSLLVPPTIGLGTIVTTPMQPLKGSGTGDLAATLTGFDFLMVEVDNVAGTAKGDVLAGLVYCQLSTGKTWPLATVYLVVT